MNLCNYKKKKGSLVIEAAVGVMVLSLSSAFVVNAHIASCKAVRERILNEDVTRNIENLKREIKYNLNKSEFDELFKDNEIGLKYDEDFGNQLLTKKLNEIDKGNDIIIKIISCDEKNIEFQVNANIEQEGVKVNISDEFEKSWWMYDEEA